MCFLPRVCSPNFYLTEVEATCNSHCIGLVKLMGSGDQGWFACDMPQICHTYATTCHGFASIHGASFFRKLMGEEWIFMDFRSRSSADPWPPWPCPRSSLWFHRIARHPGCSRGSSGWTVKAYVDWYGLLQLCNDWYPLNIQKAMENHHL